jgi:hypothetical protein
VPSASGSSVSCGSLSDDGARADLGNLPIVDLDDEDPVEDQVDLGPGLTLAHEVRACLSKRCGRLTHRLP